MLLAYDKNVMVFQRAVLLETLGFKDRIFAASQYSFIIKYF